jgi:hypothetical protein
VAQATTTTKKKGFASIALGASRSDSETKRNAKVVGSAKSEIRSNGTLFGQSINSPAFEANHRLELGKLSSSSKTFCLQKKKSSTAPGEYLAC